MSWQAQVQHDVPLARYNTWRTGGRAQCVFKPQSVADVLAFLREQDQALPIIWLGLGSNVLVRDAGVAGCVLLTAGLKQLTQLDERRFYAEAGVTCAKLAKQVGRAGLAGAEFFAGIPGSLGGALAMNAGAFGHETWEYVESVQVVNRQGELATRTPQEYAVGYRSVAAQGEQAWFVGATLSFALEEDHRSRERVKQLLAKRAATQPIGQPSCGSVFRNPENDYAARLIESAGLKGYCIGDACVSEKHANFIINQGQALASEIEQLVRYIQQRVSEVHGVSLVPEFHIVGREQ